MKKLLVVFLCLTLLTGLGSLTAAERAETRLTDVLDVLRLGGDAHALFERFTPEMQQAVPESAIASLWAQLEALGGAFDAYDGATVAVSREDDTVLMQGIRFEKLTLDATMILNGDGKIAGLSIAPREQAASEDAPREIPENVTEEEVTVGEAPWTLGGTLALPANAEGKLPAVVLVQGSGSSDRDESAYALKPFRDLSDALASAGIAVLRYDKRTFVYGKEIAASADFASFTVEQETIEDAMTAGKLLAADPRIDADRIYVLGHSLGAMMAPRIVSESNGLFAGMILACGTDRTLLDIMIRQNEDTISAITDETTRTAYAEQLKAIEAQGEALADMTAEEAKTVRLFGQSAYYFQEMMLRPKASELMKTLEKPTLIINGSRDFQVSEAEGRETWETALDTDAPWLTCLWSDVNHMLMKPEVSADKAGTTAEYEVPCTVDSDITGAIAQFILQNGGK